MRLCECGCGNPIPLSTYGSRRADGTFARRDSGAKFLRGHTIKAIHPPWWKGDDVKYSGLHRWLRENYPKTGACDECGITGKRTEYALIKDREYSRDREDYRELCKRCHNIYDEVGGSRWRKGESNQDPHS